MEPNFIISLNPSTAQELGRITAQNKDEIDSTITNARMAFPDWSARPIKERQAFLSRLSQVILDEKESIAQLIASEQGKPVAEAMASEVIAVLAVLKDLSCHARKILKTEKVNHQQLLFAHKKSRYLLQPYGVVAVISPWNYAFSVPIPEIAAALVAGNTVAFKPAPDTVLIGKKIDELFESADFPKGVMNTLFVADADAPHITHHPGIDKIVFTGSTPVGRDVMCAASHQMTPVILELGGKDPAIVAADADVPRAARGIVWGALFNAGQVCASVERVYVEKPVADLFIQRCLEEMRSLTVGDPLDASTQVGPLTNHEQLIKVQDHIQEAVRQGAKLLCGGSRLDRPGYFLQPTLLTNVNHTMRVMTEETFGPVLPVMVVDSLDETIALANDSIYGLSAYAWTSSRDTAERFMRELQAGTVMINDSTSSWGEPLAPWGGFKKSGIGRTRARIGLMEMVQVKFASYDRGGNARNVWWYPYNAQMQSFMFRAAELLYSKNLITKLKNLFPVLLNRRFAASAHWGALIKYIQKLF